MISKQILILVVLVKLVTSTVINFDLNTGKPAFDQQFYEDLLDPDLCQEQLNYIQSDSTLTFQYLDSGIRLPKGILQGNFLDLGDYHQCLGIKEDIGTSVVEGKYCLIHESYIELENIAKTLDLNFDHNMHINEQELKHLHRAQNLKFEMAQLSGVRDDLRTDADYINMNLPFTLAVCIPSTCTVEEGLNGLILNNTDPNFGFRYSVRQCRVANDKIWAPADYIAVFFFSLLGLLNFLGTSYDIWHQIICKNETKTAIKLLRSFSIYTNTIRLTTLSKNPKNLECVDGLRAISMIWVIVGHTFVVYPTVWNNIDIVKWLISWRSLFVSAAPYAVDTFFFFTGMLVVYTSVGKLTSKKLLRNLHLFYLNRVLRMFPLLAAVIVIHASVLHHVADGPMWNTVSSATNNCRNSWWITLIYMQNYINPRYMCVTQSWYLAVDMQLYFISPLVLYWVLSEKRQIIWSVLTMAVVLSLSIITTFSFLKQFSGWLWLPVNRPGSTVALFSTQYYFNTISRAPQFFIGMMIGYVLHIFSDRKFKISWMQALLLWIGALSLMLLVCYPIYLMMQLDHDLWIIDDLVNSFGKPLWCLALCWIIFACHYGYGGSINWFLSHKIWKLPSRISYAMYLIHFPIMLVFQGTAANLFYFSEGAIYYQFLSHFALTFIVSFIMTVMIDSPFSTLIKLALDGGLKGIQNRKAKKEIYTPAVIPELQINK